MVDTKSSDANKIPKQTTLFEGSDEATNSEFDVGGQYVNVPDTTNRKFDNAEAEQSEEAVSASEDAANATDENNENGDQCNDKAYARAPTIAGEFTLPLKNLAVASIHPASAFPETTIGIAHLLHSAADLDSFAPIIVLPSIEGVYQIIEGRARYIAARETHGNYSNGVMRCILFEGSEADAAQQLCDEDLGSLVRSPMENAYAVFNLQQACNISQIAIVERYPKLDKDKVSRMIVAVRTHQKYASVFLLVDKPDKIPLSLLANFSQFMKSATPKKRESVLRKAEKYKSEGKVFPARELLAAVGAEKKRAKIEDEAGSVDGTAAISDEPIFGENDEQIGAFEISDDNVSRLRLPSAQAMTVSQREAALEAFLLKLRVYFELDAND